MVELYCQVRRPYLHGQEPVPSEHKGSASVSPDIPEQREGKREQDDEWPTTALLQAQFRVRKRAKDRLFGEKWLA